MITVTPASSRSDASLATGGQGPGVGPHPLWPCHWCGIQAIDWPSLSLHQRRECRVLRRFRRLRSEENAKRLGWRPVPGPQRREWFFEG